MSFQDQIAAKLGTLKKGFVLYQHESRTDPETGFPLLDQFSPKVDATKFGWKPVKSIQQFEPEAAKKVKRNVGSQK